MTDKSESMVERVAMAIFDACGKQSTVIVLPWEAQDQEDFRAIARAAISAMREPTEAMREAAAFEFDGCSYAGCDNPGGHMYPAMIDAALSEQSKA